MCLNQKKLPIGIENFEEIITEDFYYVDKTEFIRDLLNNWGKVNLFTRPRRFGKSLNMSMLKYFFSPEGNKRIFDGLNIKKYASLCNDYMGKFPVISMSLKGINGDSYAVARDMAINSIRETASQMQYLLQSNYLTANDKQTYEKLLTGEMNEATLFSSLRLLSQLLEKHYNAKVILLIDEYDVPLAKAFEQGYYSQMVLLIRNLFEQALKTNDSILFSVLTGCMRISKESIFTGLNNLNVLSITDVEFDEYFGFTDKEVRELLTAYNCLNNYGTIKEWYNGYHFGNVEIYCPWDVICHCRKLRFDKEAQPQNYWINTSSNDAVKKFIQMSDKGTTKRDIEKLVAGEALTKTIHQELTYQNMYASVENIWSVLFTTGYLTQRGTPIGNQFQLAIPNLEIRNIFTTQIMDYFKESVQKNGDTLNRFCDALQGGNALAVEKYLSEYLRKTISIRDTFVKKEMKENFYHGILLGILGVKDGWGIASNHEAGDGYSDLLVETDNGDTGIIIEVKYASDGRLDEACTAALRQIQRCRYEEELLDDGIEHILKYGIAFYKKRCKVKIEIH